MAAKFLRGMVLPVEWEGKVTGTWLSGHTTAVGHLEALPRPRDRRLKPVVSATT